MLKRLLPALCLFALACQAPSPAWQVHFSPSGKPTAAIVETLAEARESVYVMAYSFTSAPIAEALVAAKQRGVTVEVILDRSQPTARGSVIPALQAASIPVYIDRAHAIQHNKIMIIDANTVITGSFNFSNAAETRNAENLLVIRDSRLAAQYKANWDRCRGLAIAYLLNVSTEIIVNAISLG